MSPYEIHEALQQDIAEKSGLMQPDGITITRPGHIPVGQYERNESGIWIRTGDVPPPNPNIVWHDVPKENA